MIRGIFRFMQADHLFESLASGGTEMKDIFSIAAPLPLLGPIAEAIFLRRYMLALIRERNAVIKRVAESPSGNSTYPALRSAARTVGYEDHYCWRDRASWNHPRSALSPERA